MPTHRPNPTKPSTNRPQSRTDDFYFESDVSDADAEDVDAKSFDEPIDEYEYAEPTTDFDIDVEDQVDDADDTELSDEPNNDVSDEYESTIDLFAFESRLEADLFAQAGSDESRADAEDEEDQTADEPSNDVELSAVGILSPPNVEPKSETQHDVETDFEAAFAADDQNEATDSSVVEFETMLPAFDESESSLAVEEESLQEEATTDAWQDSEEASVPTFDYEAQDFGAARQLTFDEFDPISESSEPTEGDTDAAASDASESWARESDSEENTYESSNDWGSSETLETSIPPADPEPETSEIDPIVEHADESDATMMISK